MTVARATLGAHKGLIESAQETINALVRKAGHKFKLGPSPEFWNMGSYCIALVRAMPSSCYLSHLHHRWNHRCRHHSTLKIKSGQANKNSLIEFLLKPWGVNERPVGGSWGYSRLFLTVWKKTQGRKNSCLLKITQNSSKQKTQVFGIDPNKRKISKSRQ